MAIPRKKDFPVAEIRRFIEPGPIVLVGSAWKGRQNIMTMGWHMVMEFQPSLVGCLISSGNHSFEMVRRSRECTINVPPPTSRQRSSASATARAATSTSSSASS
jgi:flavin reductase (DIM6/NTAB) family NADH-FMN oxidoreductase RutF